MKIVDFFEAFEIINIENSLIFIFSQKNKNQQTFDCEIFKKIKIKDFFYIQIIAQSILGPF